MQGVELIAGWCKDPPRSTLLAELEVGLEARRTCLMANVVFAVRLACRVKRNSCSERAPSLSPPPLLHIRETVRQSAHSGILTSSSIHLPTTPQLAASHNGIDLSQTWLVLRSSDDDSSGPSDPSDRERELKRALRYCDIALDPVTASLYPRAPLPSQARLKSRERSRTRRSLSRAPTPSPDTRRRRRAGTHPAPRHHNQRSSA